MTDLRFVDSNIWIYAYLKNQNEDYLFKRAQSIDLISQDFVINISVQVLNETANVLIKKYNQKPEQIKDYILEISKITNIASLSYQTTLSALELITKYHISWFDSLIIASTLETNSTKLYTEDMQHGQIIENRLQIINPFK